MTKISIAVAIALVAFLAAPSASFAAAKKKDDSTQRGPYTPDIVTQQHGKSRDFQGGGGQFYRAKSKKHHKSSKPS